MSTRSSAQLQVLRMRNKGDASTMDTSLGENLETTAWVLGEERRRRTNKKNEKDIKRWRQKENREKRKRKRSRE